MYQLSRPNLSGYTTIMVDEFQDANPVILDIVEQQSIRKVYVGDPHQSIYGFTGAVNTIESMEASGILSYPLTRSFRFGPNIAEFADRVLALKYTFHETKYRPGSIPKIIGAGQRSLSPANGTTILCRTNAGVVEEALALITRGVTDIHIGESISPAFLSDLKDIHWLAELQHKLVKNSYIREFRTLKSFHAECKLTGHVDYLRGITIIRKLKGQSIPRIIDQLLDLSNESAGTASHSIITAHKAKGCEWGRVRISADFEDKFFGDDGNLLEEIPIEEINLLYVAVTRAKHDLNFPQKFERILGADSSIKHQWSPAMTLTATAPSGKVGE
jgi:superfamily I DNA/RNA helicase